MYAIIIISALFVCLLGYGFLSNFILKTEYYKLGNRTAQESVKVILLADLHGNRHGIDNSRLIKKIKREAPDLICMAGDMTVKNGKGMDSCLALCKELISVCPVYYAPGNHEIRMERYEEYIRELRRTGVHWLDNSQETMTLRGRKIAIYGLDLDEEFYHKFWEPRELTTDDMRACLGEAPGFPKDEIADERTVSSAKTTILLAHNPEYFETYCAWGADLILSGHVHGGIARIPFAGGVIDPSLRLFPKYDSGIFQKGRSIMILTRGLGTHHIRLRFFNPPEISVIDL